MAPSKPTHSSHPSTGRLDQIQKGPKRAKVEAESTRANGMPMVSKLKQVIDPSQSEKFQFKNDMAKPGAEYLEARTNEKDHQRPDAHFRLFSTQHRFVFWKNRFDLHSRFFEDNSFSRANSNKTYRTDL